MNALVLAVTATWLKFLGSGPIWDHVVTSEGNDCVHRWWEHLLYINNYDDTSKCMPQTWYLATDIQLYCLGITVFVLCQSPRARKITLAVLFLMGMTISGVQTYLQDLDGNILVSPNSAVGFFMTDDTFNKVYKRGHTNIPGFISGMSIGYLFYHLQGINFDATKYKRWRPLYWAQFPLAVAIIMSCMVFYLDGARMSVFYRALAAAFIKPTFGITMALLILGTVLQYEELYRGLLEWEGWTSMGRASYSAYLLHVAVIRTSVGLQQHPITSSKMRIFEIIVSQQVLTWLGAYVFCVTVESPLNQLAKNCLEGSPTVKTKNSRPNKINPTMTETKRHKSEPVLKKKPQGQNNTTDKDGFTLVKKRRTQLYKNQIGVALDGANILLHAATKTQPQVSRVHHTTTDNLVEYARQKSD